MKTISTLILLLIAFGLNAQETKADKLSTDANHENFTEKEVTHMAVFPGCEKHDANNKEAQRICLSNELRNLLVQKLDGFSDKMESRGWTSAVTKVQFVIDIYGKIVQVEAVEGGNKELAEETVIAMNKIAKNLKKIKPAMVDDGTVVNLFFQLPVKYKVEDPKSGEFPWSEIVMSTLKDDKNFFEIRENVKESNLKVYEIKKGKESFLGNFKSYNEIISLEPYKSMVEHGEKFLLAERLIDKDVYRIYYSKTEKDQVEVYKLVNNEEEKFEFLSRFDMQYSLLYMKLVLR